MLRALLVAMSRNKTAYKLIMSLPAARRTAMRFVAGEKLAQAVVVTRELNAKGITVSLDHLGENVTEAAATKLATDNYIAALEAIAENDLKANISIKLTQLGLDIDENLCYQNISRVLQRACDLGGTFVRIDMEGSDYTERTLEMLYRLREDGFSNVGTVIQAYLYRSESDLEKLNERRIRVRLCKGAYREEPKIAFPVKKNLNDNYVLLAEKLLDQGNYPAIATHDPLMIAAVEKYAQQHKIEPSRFEFQMLYGIRRDAQEELAAQGYNMRVYVPYGIDWYPYFMRRLAERPANIMFFLTGLVKG